MLVSSSLQCQQKIYLYDPPVSCPIYIQTDMYFTSRFLIFFSEWLQKYFMTLTVEFPDLPYRTKICPEGRSYACSMSDPHPKIPLNCSFVIKAYNLIERVTTREEISGNQTTSPWVINPYLLQWKHQFLLFSLV